MKCYICNRTPCVCYQRKMEEDRRIAQEMEERRSRDNMAYGTIAPPPGGFANPFRPIR